MTYSSEDITLARKVQSTYGVPASVVLAAYRLETSAGAKTISGSNNYFNITGTGTAGSVSYNGRTWRKYNNKEESFMDFGKLLTNKTYSKLTAGTTTVEEYIRSYADTYAPPSDGNANYADSMIKIINQDNLTQYDTAFVINKGASWDSADATSTNPSAISSTITGAASDKISGILSTASVVMSLLLLAVGALVFLMLALDVKPPQTGGN